MMKEFANEFEIHSYPLSARLLDALIGTYRDWGGTSHCPQILIVDWKEVPTWSEFEILKENASRPCACPWCLPTRANLNGTEKTCRRRGRRSISFIRRVLMNDIVARPKECAALVKAYEAQAVCVANNFPAARFPT